MSDILSTEKMSIFPSITVLLAFFQVFLVNSFLLNMNPPIPSGPSNGYDANTISYLFQRMDHLQMQVQQQNKTMEAQDKTIQQLLNFTRQSPTTVSLSNDLSILQMYVRRIMDEYHRLSNISDATKLDLKINTMVNSLKSITSSLTSLENKMTQSENELHQFKHEINELNGTFSSGIQQSITNNLNQTTSTQSLQNEVSVLELMVQRISDDYHRLTNITNTTYLTERISIMANTVRSISSSLIDHEHKIARLNGTLTNTSQSLEQMYSSRTAISSIQLSLMTLSSHVLTNKHQYAALTNEINTAKQEIRSLANSLSQNQRNVSDQISSLSTKYQNELLTLTNNLHSCESRLSSLQNNVTSMEVRTQRLEDFYDFSSKNFFASLLSLSLILTYS